MHGEMHELAKTYMHFFKVWYRSAFSLFYGILGYVYIFIIMGCIKQCISEKMRWRDQAGTKSLWAAMTHLTPSAWQFLSKSTGGFRFLSDSIAREVSSYTNMYLVIRSSTRYYPILICCLFNSSET